MDIQAAQMKELRALAYDLEAMLEREVRGSKKKDLLASVLVALSELPGNDRRALLGGHGLTSTEIDPTDDADEGGEESKEKLSELPATPPAPTKEKPPKPKAKTKVERSLPYAIQIREYPRNYAFKYGDIVVNPTRELVAKTVHAALTPDGVKRLAARGSRVRKL
jgi:hypothetical protein